MDDKPQLELEFEAYMESLDVDPIILKLYEAYRAGALCALEQIQAGVDSGTLRDKILSDSFAKSLH